METFGIFIVGVLGIFVVLMFGVFVYQRLKNKQFSNMSKTNHSAELPGKNNRDKSRYAGQEQISQFEAHYFIRDQEELKNRNRWFK